MSKFLFRAGFAYLTRVFPRMWPCPRETPMLERAVVYAYFVFLVISLLLEQPVPLAVAP